MSQKMEEIADSMAIQALDLEEETGDEKGIRLIADALASSSPTMEETFLTAVRVRRAERRARRLIASMRENADKAKTKAEAETDSTPAKTED
jgi:hypothetical protein